VKELIGILNKHANKEKDPKVIVLVKDRVTIQYLKCVLKE